MFKFLHYLIISLSLALSNLCKFWFRWYFKKFFPRVFLKFDLHQQAFPLFPWLSFFYFLRFLVVLLSFLLLFVVVFSVPFGFPSIIIPIYTRKYLRFTDFSFFCALLLCFAIFLLHFRRRLPFGPLFVALCMDFHSMRTSRAAQRAEMKMFKWKIDWILMNFSYTHTHTHAPTSTYWARFVAQKNKI